MSSMLLPFRLKASATCLAVGVQARAYTQTLPLSDQLVFRAMLSSPASAILATGLQSFVHKLSGADVYRPA